jgi:enoyl-CoA hydratase/carnithine racemase
MLLNLLLGEWRELLDGCGGHRTFLAGVTLDLRPPSYSLSVVSSSADSAPVRTAVSGELLTLTLDRPERRNALDDSMRDALAVALDDAARSASIRAVVLTGAGDAFCAGGDLGRFEDTHDAGVYRHVSHQMTAVLDAVERLEKPVVAALNGAATGAGLTLALCCDWRVASPAARLLFREGRLGLVPTHGGITRLVKLVGLARAKEALLGGDDLDATAALRLGLVSEIAEGDVLAAAQDRARRMLRRAPLSFGAAKRLVHLAADADLRSGILAESLAQTSLLASDDHREGLAAARERREPEFAGR